METGAMIIRIENLIKNYGAVRALDDLNLSIGEGALFAFLGPNGAGKTTTIRILNGLTRMTSGRVGIGGVDIVRDPLSAKRQCGLAAQNINLDGELTVRENLDFHGRLYGLSGRRRRERSAALLEYVELADREDSLVKTLSGGMKRRLMVARALLHEPRVLFLDEPTAGLDPSIRRKIWNLVKKVKHDGITVFLTTHYIEEAEFLADEVGFVERGRLVGRGSPGELMARLGEWAVDRFGDTELETRYFRTREEASGYVRDRESGFTLRRVNLEDAFLAATGKKVG